MSWSKRLGFWAFRSMWKSLPASSAWATAWVKLRPAIVSCATSGLTPHMSGSSSVWLKASIAPALGGRGVDRDQVGVVQVDAERAELGELLHAAEGGNALPDRLAERVAAGVAEGPEAERKPVALLGVKRIHGYSPSGVARDSPPPC